MAFIFSQDMGQELQSIHWMILIITAIIHILFAGGVARDAGAMHKDGRPIFLVSGATWAFATLIGGVFVAAVYWFMHHVKWNK